MEELSPNRLAEHPAKLEFEATLQRSRSRRSLLKGLVVGAAGTVAANVAAISAFPALSALTAEASTAGAPTPPGTILSIARTAEQLAVTFYSNGIANHARMGLNGDNLRNIQAAMVEEQIHLNLFKAAGGKSLISTFSFPNGADTFRDLGIFIATQQALEGVFDSAFLAAVKEFAQLGRPDLAQLAAQVACIESEHRALGRQLIGLNPADNWAFAPLFLNKVGDAPKVVQDAGFFSPKKFNSYSYVEQSTDFPGILNRNPTDKQQ